MRRKKIIFAMLAVTFTSVAYVAGAAEETKPHDGGGMKLERFDTNRDGKLSKDEFMQAHEAMFDRMKGSDNAVATDSMPMNCMAMMMDGGMMGQGGGMMGQGGGMMGQGGGMMGQGGGMMGEGGGSKDPGGTSGSQGSSR